jgi:hypothetical protein
MTRDAALVALRNLTAERPTTKMGQVRWAWPEIQAALTAGHTLQLIHRRLNESGIDIGYRTLSLYIGRLQRKQGRLPIVTAPPQAGKTSSTLGLRSPEMVSENVGADPFANIRTQREKKRREGFEYHPFSTNKKLLE